MASPQVTVRLDPDTYKTLVKLAQMERKNLAELTRELIEQGLGRHQSIEMEVLDRLNQMSMELAELTARAVKASGQAAYYAKLAIETTDETNNFIITSPALKGGQVLDQEARQQRSQSRYKKAREMAEGYLKKPFNEI
jgi:predicted DNA-binding protein